VIGQDQQREVQRHIHLGHLVPLEATWLTSRGSFEAAGRGRPAQRALGRLPGHDRRAPVARPGITPLPLLGALS
jgi:hypothetical protein